MDERKQFSVRLDAELAKRFKIACAANDRKIQDVLEDAAKNYVASWEQQKDTFYHDEDLRHGTN